MQPVELDLKIPERVGALVGGAVGGVPGTIVGWFAGQGISFASQILHEYVVESGAERIAGVAGRLGVEQQQALNHHLRKAFEHAFAAAIVDIARDCFPAGRGEQRYLVAPSVVYPLAALRRNDPGAAQQLERFFHRFRDDVPVLTAGVDASQTLVELQAQLIDNRRPQLRRLFWQAIVTPYLEKNDSLLRDVPDVGPHLERHLFRQLLQHLGERLKQDTATWRAFNRLILQSIATELRHVRADTSQARQQLDALIVQLDETATMTADWITTQGVIQQEQLQRLRSIEQIGVDTHSHLQRLERKIETLRYEVAGGGTLAAPLSLPQLPANLLSRPEATHIRDHLADAGSCLLLAGLPGAGKSTTAAEAAHQLQAQCKDGTLWIDFDIIGWESAVTLIARAYGLTTSLLELGELSARVTHVGHLLAQKEALLILDGLEDGRWLPSLLPAGGRLRTIITTRNRGLQRDLPSAKLLELEIFDPDQSATFLRDLLGERFDDQAASELHALVGGLPLALNIVAGYLKDDALASLHDYNEVLRDETLRLAGLSDGEMAAVGVAASFELSYAKLPATAADLFQSLSVFVGGSFTAEACRALNGSNVWLQKDLAKLVARSLITIDESLKRYRLHPLLRLFAQQKAADKHDQFMLLAADYFIDLIEAAAITSSPPYDPLPHERENCLAVLDWCYHNRRDTRFVSGVRGLTRFAYGAYGFLDLHGDWFRASQLLGQALERAETGSGAERELLLAQAAFALRQGDAAYAEQLTRLELPATAWKSRIYRQVLLAEAAPDLAEKANLLRAALDKLAQHGEEQDAEMWHSVLLAQLAGVIGPLGDLEGAERLLQQAAELLPDAPTPIGVSNLMKLALVRYYQGLNQESLALFRRALLLAHHLTDARMVAIIANNMALSERNLGLFEDALQHHQQALQTFRSQSRRNHVLEAGIMLNEAQVALILGDIQHATDVASEALASAQQHEATAVIAHAHSTLADILLATGDTGAAGQHLDGAGEAAATLNSPHVQATVERQRAQRALAQDALDEASAAVARALAFVADRDPLERGVCQRVAAQIAAAAGEDASKAFTSSIDLLTDINPYELAVSRLSFAQYERQRGKLQAADRQATAARNLFSRLGLDQQAAACEQMLATLSGA